MKDNLHSLKLRFNPQQNFSFTPANLKLVKQYFIEIEEPEIVSVFFPDQPHQKQIKVLVSILLQGLEHADLMPSSGKPEEEDEIGELENVVDLYKEIETTFSLFLSLLD